MRSQLPPIRALTHCGVVVFVELKGGDKKPPYKEQWHALLCNYIGVLHIFVHYNTNNLRIFRLVIFTIISFELVIYILLTKNQVSQQY